MSPSYPPMPAGTTTADLTSMAYSQMANAPTFDTPSPDFGAPITDLSTVANTPLPGWVYVAGAALGAWLLLRGRR